MDGRGNTERQVMTIQEPELTDKQVKGDNICVINKTTVTLLPHHISIVPLTSINYPNKIHIDTLLEMEENAFLSSNNQTLQ